MLALKSGKKKRKKKCEKKEQFAEYLLIEEITEIQPGCEPGSWSGALTSGAEDI